MANMEFAPGDVIELKDLTKLAAFEDAVAEVVDPEMTDAMREAWAGRIALKEKIRPKRFNGTITNVELVVVDKPHERLMDARARGWAFNSGGMKYTTPIKDELVINSLIGFTFFAEAKSTGRGVIGQIQAELWYSKVPQAYSERRRVREDGNTETYLHHSPNITTHGGASVHRFLAGPKLEKRAFIELDETSRRIGFEAMQLAILHAKVQTIRQ